MEMCTKPSEARGTRMHWIDIAKCIGMFAIVYGHTIQEGWSCKYAYSFHVPLFFLLQGVVFRVTRANEKPFGQYLKSKVYTLLIPYACFCVISTAVIFLASMVITVPGLDIFSSPTELIIRLIGGDCEANSPLWFLPCSFVMAVMAYGLINAVNKHTPHIRILVLTAIAIVCGLALYVTEEFTKVKFLPWKLDAAVFMLPFFVAGYLFVEYGWIDRMLKLRGAWKAVAALLLMGIGAVLGLMNGEANYLGNYYGNVPVTYLAAFATCIGICFLSMLIPNRKLLTYVGRNTLAILLMHKFPVLLFQIAIPFTAAWIDQQNILVSIVVTLLSMALCCGAEWIICRICLMVIGKRKRVL